jgi:chemotaxis protein MotB
VGTNQAGSGENFALTKQNMEQLKEQLQKSVKQITNFDKLKNQIQMTVTSEGLRIELLEASNSTFFESGSPSLSDNGKDLLLALSQELGKLPNHVSIEGHTDSNPYTGRADYGNWELSSDRANSARRIMQANGLRSDQVTQVRGYADQKLRVPANPLEPSNRRISLIVQYIVKDEDDDDKPTPASGDKPAPTSDEKPPSTASDKPSPAVPGAAAQPAHSQ